MLLSQKGSSQKEERGEVGSSLWTLGSRPLPTHAHTSTHMHAQAHGHVPMSGEALFFSLVSLRSSVTWAGHRPTDTNSLRELTALTGLRSARV